MATNQTVNQWLGIAFIALLGFWVTLYYFVNKTESYASQFVNTAAISTHRYTGAEETN